MGFLSVKICYVMFLWSHLVLNVLWTFNFCRKNDLQLSAQPEIFPSARDVMGIVIVLNHLFAYWLLGIICNAGQPITSFRCFKSSQSNDWSLAGTSKSQHALVCTLNAAFIISVRVSRTIWEKPKAEVFQVLCRNFFSYEWNSNKDLFIIIYGHLVSDEFLEESQFVYDFVTRYL